MLNALAQRQKRAFAPRRWITSRLPGCSRSNRECRGASAAKKFDNVHRPADIHSGYGVVSDCVMYISARHRVRAYDCAAPLNLSGRVIPLARLAIPLTVSAQECAPDVGNELCGRAFVVCNSRLRWVAVRMTLGNKAVACRTRRLRTLSDGV